MITEKNNHVKSHNHFFRFILKVFNLYFILVPGRGFEPPQTLRPLEPESSASTFPPTGL